MAKEPEYYNYKLIDFSVPDPDGRSISEDAFEIMDREIPILWSFGSYNLDLCVDVEKIIGFATLYKNDHYLYARCYFNKIEKTNSIIDMFRLDPTKNIDRMYCMLKNVTIINDAISHADIVAIAPLLVGVDVDMNYAEYVESED